MTAKSLLTAGVAMILAASGSLKAAATITIVNGDAAGVGFNDPTPAAPVGGNAGTTLGQQRLIAFQAAADKWGATLTSTTTIRVLASWTALSCTASAAVLGSAGATEIFRDFDGAPKAGAWFGKAETSTLLGEDPDPTVADIRARFNINLGQTGCLTGTFFYLGLDTNHGSNIDLVTVLTHEFAHGLGFQTYTDPSTGEFSGGAPSIWDFFLLDTTMNMTWDQMTDAQRVTSSLNYGKLVWTGSHVTADAPGVLAPGTPSLIVNSPSSVAGNYTVGLASFGPALSTELTGEVMPVVDTAPNTGLACTPLSALNAAAVRGKFALVDRGTCTFSVKAENVQAAGAIGMIVADNAVGSPPAALGGTDPNVTIPSVRITQQNGAALKAALATRTRAHSGMFVTLGVNLSQLQGADPAGHVLLYAPNPVQPGSSVSHYDVSAFPNQLMEPTFNADLTHNVAPPYDLTYPLLQDIGWQ